MPEYVFGIIDNSSGGVFSRPGIQTSPQGNVASSSAGVSDISRSASGQSFATGAGKRAADQAAQYALSPLNQVTGGLATPTYQLAKSFANGTSKAAIGGAAVGIAIAALNFAIQKIKEEIAENKAKAESANNRDNLLIKSGRVTQATYYSGNLFGVRKTTRN